MRDGKKSLVRIVADIEETYQYEDWYPDTAYMTQLLAVLLIMPSLAPLLHSWDAEEDDEERIRIWNTIVELKRDIEKMNQRGQSF